MNTQHSMPIVLFLYYAACQCLRRGSRDSGRCWNSYFDTRSELQASDCRCCTGREWTRRNVTVRAPRDTWWRRRCSLWCRLFGSVRCKSYKVSLSARCPRLHGCVILSNALTTLSNDLRLLQSRDAGRTIFVSAVATDRIIFTAIALNISPRKRTQPPLRSLPLEVLHDQRQCQYNTIRNINMR